MGMKLVHVGQWRVRGGGCYMTPKEKRRMWLRLEEWACLHVSENTSHFKFRFFVIQFSYSVLFCVCVCVFSVPLCVCVVV